MIDFMNWYKNRFMRYAAKCRALGIVPMNIFDDWQDHLKKVISE